MTENKIIVDEDWKAQVQAEKEAAPQPGQTPPPPEEGPSQERAAGAEAHAFPPATLSSLIVMLASQASLALSGLPDEETEKVKIHLPLARHMIDTLEMLERKTHGNRTPEEISLLSRTLHELRMAYVAVEREVGRQPR